MKIIFCADPILYNEPDPLFKDEVAAAIDAGLGFHLVDYGSLVQENNPARAVRDIPAYQEHEEALYRGWALNVRQYERLYEALFSRGLRLITTPEAYRQAHHLPEYLPFIENHTPRTVWTHTDGHHISMDVIMPMLEKFAGQPIIVRDFVQSLKHYWLEACYIPSASNEAMVEQVVMRFLRLRAEQLVGGLVFREYVDFATLSDEMRGGKPIINEFRLLWYRGEPIATLCYWDEDAYLGMLPNPAEFAEVVHQLKSPFLAMDVAMRPDGHWHILELDDAQITTLPESADYIAIYQQLAPKG